MKAILIGATALLLLSIPGHADDDTVNPAEIRKALQEIVNDKDKLATFCEAQKLEQEAKASVEDHQEKAQLLQQKANDLRSELGLGTGNLDEMFADAEQSSEGAKIQEEISQILTNCDKSEDSEADDSENNDNEESDGEENSDSSQ